MMPRINPLTSSSGYARREILSSAVKTAGKTGYGLSAIVLNVDGIITAEKPKSAAAKMSKISFPYFWVFGAFFTASHGITVVDKRFSLAS
jgi:hypothetical protein